MISMSMASCLKETYEVRTGKLRKEREELERRTSQVPKSSLLNPATLAVRLPALAAHIREWAQSAAGEDFACLAQALDLRVIASRERAQVTVAVPVFESVQNLNSVTIVQTSA